MFWHEIRNNSDDIMNQHLLSMDTSSVSLNFIPYMYFTLGIMCLSNKLCERFRNLWIIMKQTCSGMRRFPPGKPLRLSNAKHEKLRNGPNCITHNGKCCKRWTFIVIVSFPVKVMHKKIQIKAKNKGQSLRANLKNVQFWVQICLFDLKKYFWNVYFFLLKICIYKCINYNTSSTKTFWEVSLMSLLSSYGALSSKKD